MDIKLDFSNKTWMIIAGCVLALALVILALRPGAKSGDISLTSYDGQATIRFAEISEENAGKGHRHQARCRIDSKLNFYAECIRDNEDFIGSVDVDGTFYDITQKQDTGMFLMFVNQHYFYVTCIDDYVTISELTALIEDNGTKYYFPFPADTEFLSSGTGAMDYASLAGVNNYDELRNFYARLGEDYFMANDNDQTIQVFLTVNGKLSDRRVSIRATEETVEVQLLAPASAVAE